MKENNMTDKKYTKEELDGFYKKLRPVTPILTRKQVEAALTSSHVGDCVNLPMGCDRCFAEQFFNIHYTADWKSSDGREMITALIDADMWDNSVHFEDLLEDPNNFILDDLEK